MKAGEKEHHVKASLGGGGPVSELLSKTPLEGGTVPESCKPTRPGLISTLNKEYQKYRRKIQGIRKRDRLSRWFIFANFFFRDGELATSCMSCSINRPAEKLRPTQNLASLGRNCGTAPEAIKKEMGMSRKEHTVHWLARRNEEGPKQPSLEMLPQTKGDVAEACFSVAQEK